MRVPKSNDPKKDSSGVQSEINFNTIANFSQTKTGTGISDFYVAIKNQAGIDQKGLSNHFNNITDALDMATRNRDHFKSLGFNYDVEIHPVDSYGTILWNKKLLDLYTQDDTKIDTKPQEAKDNIKPSVAPQKK